MFVMVCSFVPVYCNTYNITESYWRSLSVRLVCLLFTEYYYIEDLWPPEKIFYNFLATSKPNSISFNFFLSMSLYFVTSCAETTKYI